MTDEKKLEGAIHLLDAVYHEAGLEAVEKGRKQKRTPERQAKVDTMLARAQGALQTARAQALADAKAEATKGQAKPVRPGILAMARDAVVTRLGELMGGATDGGLTPALQFRKLEDLSTDDLRRLLADLEDQIEASEESEPDSE